MDQTEWEIKELHKKIQRLWWTVIALGILCMVLLENANYSHISVHDDLSLTYSPSLFSKSEENLRCTYSRDLQSWVVRYPGKKLNEWYDIGWLEGPRGQ